MPQLDLYIWSSCIIELFLFFILFYFFILMFFLPRLGKVFYIRKLLLQELFKGSRVLEFKLALIKEGVYWKPFVWNLMKYVSCITLYSTIYRLGLRWITSFLVNVEDISFSFLNFFFFEYILSLEQKSSFICLFSEVIMRIYKEKSVFLLEKSFYSQNNVFGRYLYTFKRSSCELTLSK